MNDFTKEELQIMLLDMNVYINRTPMLTESPSHLSLREKVQRMIDNYCEYEHKKDVGAAYKVCRYCAEEVYERV